MTRETLEEYYSIASRIQAIDEEIRILYTPKLGGSGNSIGAGRSSVMISGNPTEETALRVTALKEKLEAERERLLSLAEEIEAWLDTVTDPEIEAIVRWHYLLRCNWNITTLKVYGYKDYWYARKRLFRFFEKNENCPNCPN